MEVIRSHEGGFAIGGVGWDGDEERPDLNFSLIKLDSVGQECWRRFYSPDNHEIHDEVHGVEQLADGGYILAGEIQNVGAVIRTDSTGELLWWRTYDDFAMGFWDCALCDDNNIAVVTGSSVALKIDSENGDVLWRQNYAIEGSGLLWYAAITRDGGFLFNGRISSIGAGGSDMYVIKTDSGGEVEWYQTYGTEFTEGSTRSIQTADGGYCIGGYSNAGGGASRNTGIIVRTDPAGEEIWRNIFITEDDSIIWRTPHGIVETPDGGFAVLRDGRNHSATLGRLDSEGRMLWDVQYYIGGANTNYSYSLIRFDDFGYLLGGFASALGDWVVRTEPDSLSAAAWNLQAAEEFHDFGDVPLDSTLTWELVLTNGADYPVIIQDISVDSLAFTTGFEETLSLEPGEETSIPVTFTPLESRDYAGSIWIHTQFRDLEIGITGTGVILSVSDEPALPEEFGLQAAYPNPFNNAVRIGYQLPEATRIQLSVFDVNGRMVHKLIDSSQTAGHFSTVWQSNDLPAGVYLLRLDTGNFQQTRKINLLK